jgi:hypothetical protein
MGRPRSLPTVAATGDRLATLEALRQRLARQVDTCEDRDLAGLSLRLTDVLAQIAAVGGGSDAETEVMDELEQRRAYRGAEPPRRARAQNRHR